MTVTTDREQLLERALLRQRGWIQHWRADVECKLLPYTSGFDSAEADIDTVMGAKGEDAVSRLNREFQEIKAAVGFANADIRVDVAAGEVGFVHHPDGDLADNVPSNLTIQKAAAQEGRS